ncbi:MAG: mannitol dehydrogenase family protein [Granulosicoccus sp.]
MKTNRPQTGIVHLGLGAFFRAFGCIYVADAMASSGGDWGVVGVSLRSSSTRDALREQDWTYTAVSLNNDGENCRIISVLNDVLVAPEDPAAVLDVMVSPSVHIVSMTVTEKGYCHNPATGELDIEHADIQHDLFSSMPISAPGFIVRALQQRHRSGLGPFTVLTCDNLPENGELTRRVVLQLAKMIDPVLHDWIVEHCLFPSTMVDRITPATTESDIAHVKTLTGRYDAAPVMHEPFSQWVIEDTFVGGVRPDLAVAGVELVEDVTAYEIMKLRMLNGTHSALAYNGYLAGHETIADAMADPVFADYVRILWDEIMPTVKAPPGVNLANYADALFDRFSNSKIQHRTWQIAMDGSQKLPQRLLGTLRENILAGRESPGLLLAVAAWMRYVSGIDESGQSIDVRDPMSLRLQELIALTDTSEQMVSSLLSVREIFSANMTDMLLEPLVLAVESLKILGTRGALVELCHA